MSALDFVKALDVATRKGGPHVAMCPVCPDEVLVSTFRWTGAEFYCLGCEGLFGFVDPRPAVETPELIARIETTRAHFRDLFAGDSGEGTS